MGGGGATTTNGAAVYVCRIGCWGGGSQQHTGPQSRFVEKGRNKEEGRGLSDCLFLVVVAVVVVVGGGGGVVIAQCLLVCFLCCDFR